MTTPSRLLTVGLLCGGVAFGQALTAREPATAEPMAAAFTPPTLLVSNASTAQNTVKVFKAKRVGNRTLPYRRAASIAPYGKARVSVSVCGGPLNGDAFPEIVSGSGPGRPPLVRTADGKTFKPLRGPLRQFFAFDPLFKGGVNVAMGDVDGDGVRDIVAAIASVATSEVLVFSGVTGRQIDGFLAYDSSARSGIQVAVGDFDGDDRADIVTVPGPGLNAHVKVFSGPSRKLLMSFIAYENFTGGVNIAAGDATGDGQPDLLLGTGAGAPAHVKLIDGVTGGERASFFASPTTSREGATVALGDVNGDGRADLIVGQASGGSQVRLYDALTLELIDEFRAFPASYTGGVNVAVTR